MEYIGLQNQITSNNRKSILLLLAFPGLVVFAVYTFLYFAFQQDTAEVNKEFIHVIPIVLIIIGIWFTIAYFFHTLIINGTSGAKPMNRKDNLRVYNLTENLCMSVGMKIPNLFIIESSALNAYASGLNEKTFSVTLTSGIIDTLNDQELEGVIAHELSHIRNKDVRLLIISIIFVGIFSFVVDTLFRSIFRRRSGKRNKSEGQLLLIAMVIAIIAYFFSVLFKLSLSRKREYLADAGAVELTKNAQSLASALRKISKNSDLETKSNDIKQAFIENSPANSVNFFAFLGRIFSTHPPIEKRIEILEHGL